MDFRIKRTHFAALVVPLLALGLNLASCGGDSTEPNVEGPPSNEPVTRTIGSDGGVIETTTAQGVHISVTFPPSALTADQLVGLYAADPAGDRWLSVELQPAGLILLEPALIEVSLPEGLVAEEQNLHWGAAGELTYLPTTSGAGSVSLLTEVRTFGLSDESRVMPGSTLDTAPVGSSAITGKAAGSNTLGAGPTSCAQLLAAAQADFDRMKAQGDYRDAVNAALNTSALMIKDNCPDAEDFATMAVEFACQRLGDLFTAGLGTPITDWGQFDAQVRPVIEWHGFVQILGSNFAGPCAALNSTKDFVLAKIDDFLVFYGTRLAQLTAANLRSFVDLKQELAHIWQLWADSQTLGVQEAFEINTRGVQPTLDQLRDVGWNMARNDGVYYPLSRLTSTGFQAGRDIIGVPAPRPCDDYFNPPRCSVVKQIGWFSDQEIYEDLQFAGTDVVIMGVTVSDSVLDSGTAKGIAPGSVDNTPVLDCPTRGLVRLSGMLQGMTCWDEIEADTEMIVAVNSVDVMTLGRPAGRINYLDTPAVLQIADIVSAGVMAPKEGSFAELTVRRKRTQCDASVWGPEEFKLFTAKLNWKNPTLEVDVQMPLSVSPGDTVDVSVRVTVRDQRGQAGYFDAIDVVLQGTGGALTDLSGQTDPNGYFRTRLAVDASSLKVLAPSGAARLGISVDATATSYEGISAQGTGTSTLIDGGRVELEGRHSHQAYASASARNGAENCNSVDTQARPGSTADYEATISASASCLNATATCSGTISASAEIDGGGGARSLTASGSATANRAFEGDNIGASALGSGSAGWIFNVVGGDVAYDLTGQIAGTNNVASVIRVRELGPPPMGQPGDVIVELKVNGSINETGVLIPGRYLFEFVAGANAQAGGRFDTDAQANAVLSFPSNP